MCDRCLCDCYGCFPWSKLGLLCLLTGRLCCCGGCGLRLLCFDLWQLLCCWFALLCFALSFSNTLFLSLPGRSGRPLLRLGSRDAGFGDSGVPRRWRDVGFKGLWSVGRVGHQWALVRLQARAEGREGTSLRLEALCTSSAGRGLGGESEDGLHGWTARS